jgi:hypothetical protein
VRKNTKQQVANTAIDPTIDFTDIVLDGKTYKLTFDFASLAQAEAALAPKHPEINLLRHLFHDGVYRLEQIQELFACSLYKAQPDLDYDAAKALVNMRTIVPVAAAVLTAWKASMEEPKAEDEGFPKPPIE